MFPLCIGFVWLFFCPAVMCHCIVYISCGAIWQWAHCPCPIRAVVSSMEIKWASMGQTDVIFVTGITTGWSKATVTNNVSLTNLKKCKKWPKGRVHKTKSGKSLVFCQTYAVLLPGNLGWSIGRSSPPSLSATVGWPNWFFAVFA